MSVSGADVQAVSGAQRPVPYSIVRIRRRDQSRLAQTGQEDRSSSSTSLSAKDDFPVPGWIKSKDSRPRFATPRPGLTSHLGSHRRKATAREANGRWTHLHLRAASGQPMSWPTVSGRVPNACAVARRNSSDSRRGCDRCVVLCCGRGGSAAESASRSARGVP